MHRSMNLYAMQWVSLMPSNTASHANEVGNKTVATVEFRHPGWLDVMGKAIWTKDLGAHITPSFPLQHLVKIRVMVIVAPGNMWAFL